MRLDTHMLAWAAGIVDGEGCIFIKEGRSLRMCVSVENTDVRMLDALKEMFGGSLNRRNGPSKRNRRPIWAWEVSAIKAERCLKAIYPWLVCKKEQADIALLARRYANKRGAQADIELTKYNVAKQRQLKTRLSLVKTQPRDRSTGVKKLKIHPMSRGI